MLVKLGGVIDKCKGGGVMYDGKGGSVENEKKRGGGMYVGRGWS